MGKHNPFLQITQINTKNENHFKPTYSIKYQGDPINKWDSYSGLGHNRRAQNSKLYNFSLCIMSL